MNLPDQSTLHAERYDKALTLTASVKAGSAKASAQTKDVGTGYPSDYTPAAGDVVEFEYARFRCIGIMAPDGDIAGQYPDRSEGSFNLVKVSNLSFTGEKVTGLGSWEGTLKALGPIAKAYFADKPPVFSGTYKERQAQWIKHHGLEVGSKVKVVRKFKAGEDGSSCLSYTSSRGKEQMQGQVCEIEEITGDKLWISRPNGVNVDSFPYTVLEPVY